MSQRKKVIPNFDVTRHRALQEVCDAEGQLVKARAKLKILDDALSLLLEHESEQSRKKAKK